MGSTPTKHLRGGADTLTNQENREAPRISTTYDLDSSDSDITLLGELQQTRSSKSVTEKKSSKSITSQEELPKSKSIKAITWKQSESQMSAGTTSGDEGKASPSTKIYSREPPEKDESSGSKMRNYSTPALQQYQQNDANDWKQAHSKSSSSVPQRRPEDFFNTSLIDGPDSDNRCKCDQCLGTRDPCFDCHSKQFAVDDESSFQLESCCCCHSVPPVPHQSRSHCIKHYKSACDDPSCCRCQKCTCCHCHECRMCPYPDDDQTSTYSSSSQTTDFMDLAYQNNDEYLGLVHELEETLSQRNRERVLKTMREFEYLSRQNKALERPIFDDEDDESQTKSRCRGKGGRRRPRSADSGGRRKHSGRKECVCSFARRAVDDCDRRLSQPPQKAGYVGNAVRSTTPCASLGDAKSPKASRGTMKWRLDPRTGEWFKAYGDQEEVFRKESPPSRQHRSVGRDSPVCSRRDAKECSCHKRRERCSNPRCCCCRHSSKF